MYQLYFQKGLDERVLGAAARFAADSVLTADCCWK